MTTVAYSETNQTSKSKLIAKTVNSLMCNRYNKKLRLRCLTGF